MSKLQKKFLIFFGIYFIVFLAVIITFAVIYGDYLPVYAIIVLIVFGLGYIGMIPGFIIVRNREENYIVEHYGDEENKEKDFHLIKPRSVQVFDSYGLVYSGLAAIKINKESINFRFGAFNGSNMWSSAKCVNITEDYVVISFQNEREEELATLKIKLDKQVYYLIKTFYDGDIIDDENVKFAVEEKYIFKYSMTIRATIYWILFVIFFMLMILVGIYFSAMYAPPYMAFILCLIGFIIVFLVSRIMNKKIIPGAIKIYNNKINYSNMQNMNVAVPNTGVTKAVILANEINVIQIYDKFIYVSGKVPFKFMKRKKVIVALTEFAERNNIEIVEVDGNDII